MNRNRTLKVVNPILGILMLNQVATGLFHDALSHEAFELMHQGGGIALAIVAGVHVALNWTWIRATYLRRSSPGKE